MQSTQRLGKYTIVEVLGKGAMGIVYKGWDPVIERHVALKTIRKELIDQDQAEEFIARFKNEAQAGGRMTHPGIVSVFEYGEEGETTYIAMEYVRGHGLRDYFAKNERFGLHESMEIMGQLLEALEYAHGCGVVHRDIKPANLIITIEGRLKLADFGIARLDNSHLTLAGSVIGTPSYMSPEQFAGTTVDRRTDIFSAGVVLFELLTGTKPFEGPTETISHKVCNEAHRNPSEVNPQEVPAVFDAVVAKALAKKREYRFQTALEFRDALVRAFEGRASTPGASAEITVVNEISFPGVPAERPETTTYPPSNWPVEDLRVIEKLLAPHVGPMAKVLVKRAAKRALGGHHLVTMLVEEIPDPAARKAFLASVATKAGVLVGDYSAGVRPSSTNPRGVVQKPLERDEIERAEKALTLYIGPIAKFVVRKAAAHCAGKQAFYSELAENIDNDGERARFLEESALH
jgi:serine/threonine-protein kinase